MIMINIIGKENSVFNQFMAELRDSEIQKDRQVFRMNLERIGEIFAYEISKTLEYQQKEVVTSLGTATVLVLSEYPVIVPILRAGLPMFNGLLRFFGHSESAFISAFRKFEKNEKFVVNVDYISCPDITGRTVIICDPLLASGASLVAVYKALISRGKPKKTHIAVAIASVEGIEYVKKHLPVKDIVLWTGAVDDELTAQAYIVPGLGDAGDLAYGNKN
jgi:uracil phosphoribosyltransferase